jgi:ATP-dependent DNA helicase HFM1/MER3
VNTQLTVLSAKKLNRGQEVMFEAKLTSATQTVRAYVMCDTIGMLI